jgi:hypothetical protein
MPTLDDLDLDACVFQTAVGERRGDRRPGLGGLAEVLGDHSTPPFRGGAMKTELAAREANGVHESR